MLEGSLLLKQRREPIEKTAGSSLILLVNQRRQPPEKRREVAWFDQTTDSDFFFHMQNESVASESAPRHSVFRYLKKKKTV